MVDKEAKKERRVKRLGWEKGRGGMVKTVKNVKREKVESGY